MNKIFFFRPYGYLGYNFIFNREPNILIHYYVLINLLKFEQILKRCKECKFKNIIFNSFEI